MTGGVQCFIGLGSNLDDPLQQIKSAFHALRLHPEIQDLICSSLYGSAPMGPADQPDYVNAVAMLTTTLSAHELLDVLQHIEKRQGRARTGERWGPRTLDLDLLAYGDESLVSERLQVPHPGIAERGFVLLPWAEIAPAFLIPGLGQVDALASRFAADELDRLEKPPQ